MFRKNSARARSDESHYGTYDCYSSMPEYLRKAREKYKNYGLPTTSSTSLTSSDEESDVDDEEGLLSTTILNNFGAILYMLAHRIYRSIIWIFGKVPYLPEQVQRMRLNEGVRRLLGYQLRVEMENMHVVRPWDLNTIEEPDVKCYEIFAKSGERIQVVEIRIEGCSVALENFLAEYKDFQSLILHKRTASLIWILRGNTRIVLVNETSDPSKGSPLQLFRRILSDMALTDSIIIGHPYYWHPVIRKKLKRAVSQLKKLYATIDRRDQRALRERPEPDPVASIEQELRLSTFPAEFIPPIVHLDNYSECKGKRMGSFSHIGSQTRVTVSTARNRDKYTATSALDSIMDAWDQQNRETNVAESDSIHVSAEYSHTWFPIPETFGCSSEVQLHPDFSRRLIDHNNITDLSSLPRGSRVGSRPSEPTLSEIYSRSEQKTWLPDTGRITSHRKHNQPKGKHRNKTDDVHDLNEGSMDDISRQRSPRESSTASVFPVRSRTHVEPVDTLNSVSSEALQGPSGSSNENGFGTTAASSEWGDQDPNYEKLGLSRTRHSHTHRTINEDLIPGPPVMNFYEPNAIGNGAVIRLNAHHDGIHDLPPADADTFNPLTPIQPRQFNSTDNLSGVVDQLGLETGMTGHAGHGHVDLQPHRHGSGRSFHHPQSSLYEISQNKCLDSLDLDSSSGPRFSHKGVHKGPSSAPPPENGDGF